MNSEELTVAQVRALPKYEVSGKKVMLMTKDGSRTALLPADQMDYYLAKGFREFAPVVEKATVFKKESGAKR